MCVDRDEALELLRQNHRFPGVFPFRIVVRPESRPAVLSAVAAYAPERVTVSGVTERVSRAGGYVSLHVDATCADAEDVLGVWALLKTMPEVVMTL